MVRTIEASLVENAVQRLFVQANTVLPDCVVGLLDDLCAKETSESAKSILKDITRNASIARSEQVAMCQDTGVACVFFEIGQDVHITGGDFVQAVNEGIRKAYLTGCFRSSVVDDPIFVRKNTGDNTPAFIHVDIVPGDRIRLHALPKGTGSENMSALRMLTPADGVGGLKEFVLETVRASGPNACPPLIVGVGAGGMMDHAALLSKKALLRDAGAPSTNREIADLEKELLESINHLNIGAGGLGGKGTALAVHIEVAPTHIGAFPVAVNLQCHAARHAFCVI